MIDLEKGKDLLIALRQSIPDHQEYRVMMAKLIDAQSLDGKKILEQALKAQVRISQGATLIKIPKTILSYLPDSYKEYV